MADRPMTLDLLVIGAGTAGQTVARKCAAAGWNVAIVDELPYGGTCALRGCDPKKVLVAAAEAWDWQRRLVGKGVSCQAARIDWGELQAFVRSFTDPVPQKTESGLREAGVRTLHGTAVFRSPEKVEIEGRSLEPGHIVVATGAEPMSLGFEGEEHLIDSTAFLRMQQLPSEILFVGGGFVSFEFAHVAARAGAKVRILEMADRPLGPFDADLVALLTEASRELGIEITTETRVTEVERVEGGFRVHAEGPEGAHSQEVEIVVHGAGRVPRLGPLDLEAGEVAREKSGVAVDAHLRSVSNPRVFAAGDAAAVGLPLTPVAAGHGHVVAANLLGDERTVDDGPVPSVVFTLPPLAMVGQTQKQASDEGIEAEVHHRETSGWYSSRRIGERHGAHKTIVEKGSGRLLGAHLLGHGAEEEINLFALAMRAGMTATELRKVAWAYPTKASDVPYMV